MMSATASTSASKSATKVVPIVMASAIDLEISDLPPPETVDGLWQTVS